MNAVALGVYRAVQQILDRDPYFDSEDGVVWIDYWYCGCTDCVVPVHVEYK